VPQYLFESYFSWAVTLTASPFHLQIRCTPNDQILIELCIKPELQVELRAELSSHFSGGDQPWDEFSLSSMFPYLDAVVPETSRLYPPLVEISRMVRTRYSCSCLSKLRCLC
jgi:hypothetical protein